MLIHSVNITSHPGIGNVSLDLTDVTGAPSSVLILAGGNGSGKTAVLEALQNLFEGNPGQETGQIDVKVQLDDSDIVNLTAATVNGAPATDPANKIYILHHDSSQAATNQWESMYSLKCQLPDGSLAPAQTPMLGNSRWTPVFRSFYSEANVNFSAPRLETIRSTVVDPPTLAARRSGPKIAQEIAQLIVDIRSADSEDLAVWVRDHPNVAPPIEVQNIRFSRFLRAFEYMFPNKIFKEIRREDGIHIPEFEEFGKTSSLDKLSTGEKQIVFRAGFLLRDLANIKSSVVLIDEPELSLHPEWQARIIGFYKHLLTDTDGSHPQMIIATHSPFIVHGAGSSKVIILEKDQVSGAVAPMASPAYPSVAASEAVRAFNIDAFLSDVAASKLLVLTEGETDKIIIETAWSKLHPGQQKPFELRSALGAKNINITLNDDQVLHKMSGRKVVGLFDFDSAYNHWNGLWKNRGSVVGPDTAGLIKKHSVATTLWGLLLPVPGFRQGFASSQLKGESILSIEFLFEDADHIPGLVGQKQLAAGLVQPVIVDAKKAEFAAHVATLTVDKFSAFAPLFLRFDQIINGAI